MHLVLGMVSRRKIKNQRSRLDKRNWKNNFSKNVDFKTNQWNQSSQNQCQNMSSKIYTKKSLDSNKDKENKG